MSFREKSGWAVIGTLAIAYLGYVVAVVGRIGGAGVDAVEYADAAVGSAVAVVVLLAAAHIVLAAVTRSGTGAPAPASSRGAGATILAAGTVSAIVLTLTGAAEFWAINVLIAALVAGEIATAAARIADERRAVRRA